MEIEIVMALWLAEIKWIHRKNEELAVSEEFFLNLTLEFDRAQKLTSAEPYLGWLLTQIELYLSGDPDRAMSNVLAVANATSADYVEKDHLTPRCR